MIEDIISLSEVKVKIEVVGLKINKMYQIDFYKFNNYYQSFKDLKDFIY